MKCQKWKIIMIAAAMAAAGLSYSCSRQACVLETGGSVRETLEPLPDGGDESAKEQEGGADTASPAFPDGKLPPLEPSPCYVHICGEVASPGVYELEEGDRIYQAIEKAGGFTEGAAREYLNLAGRVTDGMKLAVPRLEDLEGEKQYGPEDSGREQLININTASKEQLMSLNGIGSARAEAVIRYREGGGGFQKIEDIMKVPGIKDAAFQKIKDDITV